MSLSQESLHNQHWSTGVNGISAGTIDGNSSYFGYMGPLGPPAGAPQNREASRRASDPIKPLERGFNESSRRMHRYNSYSNFKNPAGLRSPMAPHYNHPNQGLQLDQVGEDESIESKLILPDDMVNYLNQVRNCKAISTKMVVKAS